MKLCCFYGWFRSFTVSMTYYWLLDAFVYPQSEILVFMASNTCSLPSTVSGLGLAAYLKTSTYLKTSGFVEAFHLLYKGQAFSKTFRCLVDEGIEKNSLACCFPFGSSYKLYSLCRGFFCCIQIQGYIPKSLNIQFQWGVSHCFVFTIFVFLSIVIHSKP